MRKFSSFNQIVLSLFVVSNAFHNVSKLILKRKYVKRCKQLKYYRKHVLNKLKCYHKMSNKLNKIFG